MSTLAEIEQAVEALPRPDQEVLWQHLSRRLFNPSGGASAGEVERQRWLEELRTIRERNATGKAGAPLQEVMDELRGEKV